jgi:hypothetical protein
MELTEEVKALLLNTAKERKRQRAPDVYGADSSSPGSWWSACVGYLVHLFSKEAGLTLAL